MLQVANYKKAYGSHLVLDIPLLQLNEGVYWLKGENGAGKSTFLRSLAGLIPFDGDVTFRDVHLRRQRRAYTKLVSFAEAEPVYPAFLTGTDLLRFYAQTKGNNKTAEALRKELGLQAYEQQKLGNYSSGMLKKLSLVLAFMGTTGLILLDEPFITLDVAAVETLQQAIVTCSKQGVSFLISSHQELQLQTNVQQLSIRQRTIQTEEHVSVAE